MGRTPSISNSTGPQAAILCDVKGPREATRQQAKASHGWRTAKMTTASGKSHQSFLLGRLPMHMGLPIWSSRGSFGFANMRYDSPWRNGCRPLPAICHLARHFLAGSLQTMRNAMTPRNLKHKAWRFPWGTPGFIQTRFPVSGRCLPSGQLRGDAARLWRDVKAEETSWHLFLFPSEEPFFLWGGGPVI